MAVSDQLRRLADRTKQLEERAAAAETKAKAELEQEVNKAREAAQGQAADLRKSAEETKEGVSVWWDSVQRSWDEHLAAVRKSVDERRAAHDLKTAQRAADQTEDDATFAIAYAYAAVEEADYAVLDASLARMEADELAAQ